LIMTDVDGTLTRDGDHFEPVVADAVARLEADGIDVGLVSGKTLCRLEVIASLLGTKGPLIAENGGVAQLTPGGAAVDLGYSKDQAVAAAARLESLYPGLVRELADNSDRFVDVTISADGLSLEELQPHMPGVQLLDSGYMIHLMPEGISKGRTLVSLLDRVGRPRLSPDEVMVFGDSVTDISLFREFANSVLISNPRLSAQQRQAVAGIAAYSGELLVEMGFAQVVMRVLELRRGRQLERPARHGVQPSRLLFDTSEK
jgi:hypothetical protein